MSACGIGEASVTSLSGAVALTALPPGFADATTFSSAGAPGAELNAARSSTSASVFPFGMVTSGAVTPGGSPSTPTVTASSNSSRTICTNSRFSPP